MGILLALMLMEVQLVQLLKLQLIQQLIVLVHEKLQMEQPIAVVELIPRKPVQQ